jgi:hypothetical protein
MNKEFYYVVEKQLTPIEEVEETNGWKTISVYEIENNKPKCVAEFDIENEDKSEAEISTYLVENEIVGEEEEITLTQL